MERLLLAYNFGDMGCAGLTVVPFEYESKDKFVYDQLEKFNKEYWEENFYANVLGEFFDKEQFKNIEKNIFTFEEWFEGNKHCQI